MTTSRITSIDPATIATAVATRRDVAFVLVITHDGGADAQEIRFAVDSPLEGDGFGLTALSDYPKNPQIPPFLVSR